MVFMGGTASFAGSTPRNSWENHSFLIISLALSTVPWRFFNSAMEKKRGGKEQKKLQGDRLLPPKVLKRCGREVALMLLSSSPCSKQQHRMCWRGGSWLGGSAPELGDRNGRILGIWGGGGQGIWREKRGNVEKSQTAALGCPCWGRELGKRVCGMVEHDKHRAASVLGVGHGPGNSKVSNKNHRSKTKNLCQKCPSPGGDLFF